MITCLMWSIWSERNKEIHGTKPKRADLICTFSASHLAQYHKVTSTKAAANDVDSNRSNGQVQHPPIPVRSLSVWQPPAASCFKLNLKATCDNAGAIIGFGALIRDHAGAVIAGFLSLSKGVFLQKKWRLQQCFIV
uniref:RNase H type-1 domain-containing protein n=1 Tax=Cannabis sativa TaxID=3483 RepID=A0A803PRG5_CANSA